MQRVQYLKDLQQQLYLLLDIYSELKIVLESAHVTNEHSFLFQELEGTQIEIAYLLGKIRLLSTNVK